MTKKVILSLFFILINLSNMAQENFRSGRDHYMHALAMEQNDQTIWGQNEAKESYAKALAPLQAAAKEGYGEACYLLGKMYYYGKGTEKNYMLAMRMYERAIEFGYNKGEAELGLMYENGDNCTADPEKAFELYSKSALKGNLYGKYMAARCLYYGIGTEQNFSEALVFFNNIYNAWHNPYAKAENKPEQWYYQWTCSFLGDCYEYGRGVSPDMEKSVLYYQESNKPEALFTAAKLIDSRNLKIPLNRNGNYYSRTHYISKSDLLEKAIDKGLDQADAYYLSVKWNYENKHYEGDITKAYASDITDSYFKKILKSAEMGYGPAQKLLGDWYKEGKGTPVNLIKAREWYAKAKANGEEVPE